MGCEECGNPEARFSLDATVLCDRCLDDRVAAQTGMPRLPDPPPPLVLDGSDGRRHRLRFRIWRAPTGVEVQVEETDVPVGEGYQFAVLGDHDADVEDLLARVRTLAEQEVVRSYLEPSTHGPGWVLRDDEVAGRLIWDDGGEAGAPYRVVVDGRTLSWEELGMALAPYEGWSFRLVIEDSVHHARPDAVVVELPRPAPGPEPPGG